MIVWFDSNMTMHIDRNNEAYNNFSLAKYNAPESVFKANAVVEGKTLLFTHAHVTENATCLPRMDLNYYCSSSTRRKHFLTQYSSKVEEGILKHLRGNRNYTGTIKLRFKVGESTLPLFRDLGYTKVETCSRGSSWDSANYIIVEKKLQ